VKRIEFIYRPANSIADVYVTQEADDVCPTCSKNGNDHSGTCPNEIHSVVCPELLRIGEPREGGV
jgi:hypothetical protein